jgi:hypothetical protein
VLLSVVEQSAQRRFVGDQHPYLLGVLANQFESDQATAAIAEHECRLGCECRQQLMRIVGEGLDRGVFGSAVQWAAGQSPGIVGEHRVPVGKNVPDGREPSGVSGPAWD